MGADNKRVVLISDGVTAVDVQDSTLGLYGDNGVLLDVVAWTGHADRVLLKSWADATGGNFDVVKERLPHRRQTRQFLLLPERAL